MSTPFSIQATVPVQDPSSQPSNSLYQLNPEKDKDVARSLQNLQFLIQHYGPPYRLTFWPGWDRSQNRSYIRASWKSTYGVINWKFRNLNWDGQHIRSSVASRTRLESSSMEIEESEATVSEAARATQELIHTLQLPITLPELPIQVDYRGLHLNEEAIIFDRFDSAVAGAAREVHLPTNMWVKSTAVVCPKDRDEPTNPVSNAIMKRYRGQYNAYVVANAEAIPHGTYIVVNENGINHYNSYKTAIDEWGKGLAYISDYNGLDSENYVLRA